MFLMFLIQVQLNCKCGILAVMVTVKMFGNELLVVSEIIGFIQASCVELFLCAASCRSDGDLSNPHHWSESLVPVMVTVVTVGVGGQFTCCGTGAVGGLNGVGEHQRRGTRRRCRLCRWLQIHSELCSDLLHNHPTSQAFSVLHLQAV